MINILIHICDVYHYHILVCDAVGNPHRALRFLNSSFSSLFADGK